MLSNVAPAPIGAVKHPPLSVCRSARALVASTLLLVAVLAGCTRPTGPPCFPVRGTVTQGGKPLAEVMVVLHPLTPPTEPFPLPLGYTDAQGRFALQTLGPVDGAPSGEYAITLELRELRRSGEEMIRDGRSLLPSRYATPQTSPLRVTVVEGPNEVPPIAVTPR